MNRNTATIRFQSPARPSAGFTLLELMTVVAILGLMLFLVLPNLDNILPGARISGAARTLAATVDFARSQAIFTGKPYEVHVHLDERWYQVIRPEQISKKEWEMGVSAPKAYLPAGVRFRDIAFATGTRIDHGLVRIRLSPFGRFDEFVVHLIDTSRKDKKEVIWTVQFNPLTGLAEFYNHDVALGKISERDLFQP